MGNDTGVKTQACSGCGEEKPLAESYFATYKLKLAGKSRKVRRFRKRCRECVRLTERQWREKNLEASRQINRESETRRRADTRRHDYLLRRKYGITSEDYATALDVQGGGCAICGKPPTNRRLSVDHDHKTGKVRGLLCMSCNRGLGTYKDNSANLRKAAEYLDNPPFETIGGTT